jgi:ferredoxin
MSVTEASKLSSFLEAQSQKEWLDALVELEPEIHPVDRLATRIWFAFWPLDLNEALSSAGGESGVREVARLMDLEGNWRLEKQIDSAVGFLHGAHHWVAVKEAVLALEDALGSSLAATIRRIASEVSRSEKVDQALVLGIAAVGLMMLRQVGAEALEAVRKTPAEGPLLAKDPRRVLANRERRSADGLFTFLKGVNRRWEVRWEERRPRAIFRAFNGQDMAMAGAQDGGEYRSLDYRRVDGPVPVECRVGSCGYCWVGILSGRENLTPISEFERSRLQYFGYDAANAEGDANPPVRLACQAQCHGDVTLTIPPWNGELSRRHDEGRHKLGTA